MLSWGFFQPSVSLRDWIRRSGLIEGLWSGEGQVTRAVNVKVLQRENGHPLYPRKSLAGLIWLPLCTGGSAARIAAALDHDKTSG